jgi:tetratricopeptide (TPR) repeat protein
MRLPDRERSRGVLIGSGTYASPDLPDVPAVHNNVRDLKRELIRSGRGAFHPEHCAEITDPADVHSLGRQLLHVARQAEDVLLVYFAGHGLLGPRRGELYLALGDTDPDALVYTAMPIEGVREAFLESPAQIRVLVLDCCFSGRAIPGHLADEVSAVLGQIDIAGTYILTSAAANETALTGEGTRHTVFTGELIAQLRGATSGLTLGDLYERLRRSLAAHGLPRPQRLGTDTAQSLVLVPEGAGARGAERGRAEPDGPPEDPPEAKAERARRLAEGGDYAKAIMLFESEVLWKPLPRESAGEIHAAYAEALRGQARAFGGLRRYEEAVEARREAAGVYRRLAREDPGRYRLVLGEALLDLSVSLRRLRRFEMACEVLEEAVPLFRSLYADDPATHPRGLLAKALDDLGTTLNGVGRLAQATGPLREAVRLYRILDEEDPGLYREVLADTLMILGGSLSKLERHDEAAEEHAQAMRLYRVLSRRDAAAFRPRLARALVSLAGNLAAKNRHDEAGDAYAQAVDLYRAYDGAAYRSSLARSLGGLAVSLARVGRTEEAGAAAEEAVWLSSTLGQEPGPDLAVVADTLMSHGASLAKRERHAEARQAHARAVELFRTLAAADVAAYRPRLADALGGLAADLARLGREDEARRAREEAEWLS